MAAKQDLSIRQGETFSRVVRWESTPIVYKPISAITQTAPAAITSTAHGVPEGWRIAVVSVKGMTQINAKSSPPSDADYKTASVVDANTVKLNEVNASDFKAYSSGGYIQYNTPVDLTGYTARMKVRTKIGGTLLASTEAADAPLDIINVTLNNSTKAITISIDATDTAGLTWTKGVYDFEVVSVGGVVTTLLYGSISVTKEVTS